MMKVWFSSKKYGCPLPPDKKQCGKCRALKNRDEDNFWKCKKTKDGFQSRCKICLKNIFKENKDHIISYLKTYYLSNHEEMLKYRKVYREKPENKTKRNKNEIERRKTDIVYRLRTHFSKRINKELKFFNSDKKKTSILNFLPYSIKELKEHLEQQFQPWMSWENYGSFSMNKKTWNIDHVIPQSCLPYDSMTHPNFLLCWRLGNLQPLEAKENIKKGDKILFNEQENMFKGEK